MSIVPYDTRRAGILGAAYTAGRLWENRQSIGNAIRPMARGLRNAFNRRSYSRPAKRQRMNRSFRGAGGGRRGSSGVGVTNQHDRAFVYRKKRMPRRRGKRWMKFSRKVHFVAEKDLGTRTIVMNGSRQIFNTTSGMHLS